MTKIKKCAPPHPPFFLQKPHISSNNSSADSVASMTVNKPSTIWHTNSSVVRKCKSTHICQRSFNCMILYLNAGGLYATFKVHYNTSALLPHISSTSRIPEQEVSYSDPYTPSWTWLFLSSKFYKILNACTPT